MKLESPSGLLPRCPLVPTLTFEVGSLSPGQVAFPASRGLVSGEGANLTHPWPTQKPPKRKSCKSSTLIFLPAHSKGHGRTNQTDLCSNSGFATYR